MQSGIAAGAANGFVDVIFLAKPSTPSRGCGVREYPTMKTRRDFLRATAVGATAATGWPRLVAGADEASRAMPAGAPAARPAAANSVTARHRNLFNGDSCVFFYNPEKWQPEGGPYSAKAIHRYVDVLADNGVDTFLVNANASNAWYPSKTLPTILDGYRRGDREFFRGHAICAGATEPAAVEKFLDSTVAFFNLYVDLMDAGVDWLAEAAKACRRRGVSPWVSIRMNDMHGHRNYEGSHFNAPLLKRKEMRLSRSAYSPTMWIPDYREGLNYARPEVRAYLMAQIREVVEDYDYEGLELDWWRNPLCCEPDATAETVEMMNAWFREVRALTERRAQRTGRPFPLGFRMPGRLDALKSIGIDVVTLCREGTLDFICPSHFWRTSWDMPHDELRRQVGERVAIYGVIEDGVNRMAAAVPTIPLTRDMRYISASHELMRGNAAGKLALGADGIECYNFFCTDQAKIPGVISDYATLRDLHRLEALRGRPKHYAFSDQGSPFVQIPFERVPQVPVVLERGWIKAFTLPMCTEPRDRGLELVIQVVLKADDVVGELPVAFNGCWPRREHTASDRLLFPCGAFTHHAAANRGYEVKFPVSLVREGWNEITVENGGDRTITVVGIELAVRARASSA